MNLLLTTLAIVFSASISLAETTSNDQNDNIINASDSTSTNSYCVAADDYLQKRLKYCNDISGKIGQMNNLLAVRAARHAVWKLKGAIYLINVASGDDAKNNDAACEPVSYKNRIDAASCVAVVETNLAAKLSPNTPNPPKSKLLDTTTHQEFNINLLTYMEAFDDGSTRNKNSIRKLEKKLGMR